MRLRTITSRPQIGISRTPWAARSAVHNFIHRSRREHAAVSLGEPCQVGRWLLQLQLHTEHEASFCIHAMAWRATGQQICCLPCIGVLKTAKIVMKRRAPSYQEICLLLARPATARSHFLSTAHPLDKTSEHLNHSSRLLLLKSPLLLYLHILFLFNHENSARLPDAPVELHAPGAQFSSRLRF